MENCGGYHTMRVLNAVVQTTAGEECRSFAMSRHWHRVSRSMQKHAAGAYPIMSEGMSPYETCYVLATDEEIRRLERDAMRVFAGPAEL
jgi:hypothetical protein